MQKTLLSTGYLKDILLVCMLGTSALCADDTMKLSGPRLNSAATADDFGMSPTEDLMREHGLLSRILLIYEYCAKKLRQEECFPQDALEGTVDIMNSFVENYHEKLEEDYIFPLFEKNKKELQLVKTLRTQHDRGRAMTVKIKKIVQKKGAFDPANKKQLRRLLEATVTMFRPHTAREDTLLFPQVRLFMSEKEFKALGDKFEDLEDQLFGENGFEAVVNKVKMLEKRLGIDTLENFTASVGFTKN